MVFKKKSGYGFNGYRVPVIPRAPRSVRRRGLHKKAVEDSEICAFELLAAVAGKLLQESDSSASSYAEGGKDHLGIHKVVVKHELEGGKALRSECIDQGSCSEGVFASGLAVQERNSKSTLKEYPHAGSNSVLGRASLITSSDFSKKLGCDVKSEICESKNAASIVEGGSPRYGESSDGNMENGIERQLEVDGKQTGDFIVANTRRSKDPMEICMNTNALVNSDGSVQLPLYRDSLPNASFPKHGNNVKVGIRDDDENLVGCNQPSTKIRAFRPQSRIGYRRIRKLLTSKYWKAAPKLKDYELPNTDGGMKPVYRNRKFLYSRKRCQHEAPYKRRKLCNYNSTVAYDRAASSESISNSPEKGMKAAKKGSSGILHKASGVSSSVLGHQACFQSRDSHVKFSIKSFKVPDLYIEVPETATVGSLKRKVLEAVTSILGGGLHVGVLLQGKNVRDDNRTLLQTGISHNDNLETLGFTLEPSSAQTLPLSPKDPPFLLPCGGHEHLTRSPGSPIMDSDFANVSFDPPLVTDLNNHGESKLELVPSPVVGLKDEVVPDSRALVSIPAAMSAEALAMVPMNQKTRRSELGQRRTRRPFSVSEVEALVEAVEKLGTGRWRDVKLRAFDSADHRTYVDLKDKWKTLVHTASISPQQRRGEPVPQELLDRVLSAHSYWSQHQSKQHNKHQGEPLKISSEAPMGGIDGV
ncbi:telomere repeat-binding protein 2-like [Cornus florida]|uniref:telomere repeat-binding protein 2-like n=1 Tax=Cornus florida TaxID=4283 RepID=UPI00289C5393|nr:telomere repeat-binding protein 2-like [Cornus florida]XP_059666289.1 telomere repeat-binding protein 2-like [Cornus florida]